VGCQHEIHLEELNMTRCPFPKRQGFSLLELVLVVTLGSMLLGLLLPALAGAQVAAGRKDTLNNLKQLGQALHHCQAMHKKQPPAFDKFGDLQFPASVHVHLLPYLKADNSFQEFLKQNGQGEVTELKIAALLAADDPSQAGKDQRGIQNFAANLRIFSTKGYATKFDADMAAPTEVMPGAAKINLLPDGASNTIAFATKYGYCAGGGSRYAAPPNAGTAAFFGQNAAQVKAHPSDKTATYQLVPEPKDCCHSPLMAQSFYKFALQVVLADGSTRTITPGLTPRTWNTAVQPNDFLTMAKDWED
jgi:prepilin-type N-terminal cleavage/methylation domain-containing protein